MTNLKWNALENLAQLDEIDELSKKRPVLIFKHSIHCSTSAATLHRFESKWDNIEAGDLEPYYLDLITNRDVSNEIASRYDVTHQSPQALLIVNGKCVHNNSHFGISFKGFADRAKTISA